VKTENGKISIAEVKKANKILEMIKRNFADRSEEMVMA